MKLLTSIPVVILLTLLLIFALIYGAINFGNHPISNTTVLPDHAAANNNQAVATQQDNTVDSAYQSSYYATQPEQPIPNQTKQSPPIAKPDVSLPTTDKTTTTTNASTNTATSTDPKAAAIKEQSDRGLNTSTATAIKEQKERSTTAAATTTASDIAAQKERDAISPAQTTTTAKTYPYLVSAGAFLNQDKAQIVLTQMKELGYKDAYFYKNGTVIKVIIAAFAAEQDAKNLVANLAAKGVQATVTKK
jgi:hypothetical protein